MGVLMLAAQLVLYTVIAALLLIFIPGIPPHMKIESYEVAPPSKLEGKYAPNAILDKAELYIDGDFEGPESVAIRGDEVFTGVMDGRIIRVKDGKWETVVQTGRKCAGLWETEICGRPLGLRFEPSGKLLVADGSLGLLRVDVDKKTVETILPKKSKIDGTNAPLNFADDVDITSDGIIYFSDVGQHSSMADFLIDTIGEPTGRLLQYDTKTKKSQVLLDGIRFANGVQLSKKEDFVVICETGLGRVLKYHLKGAKKGQVETLVDGLPGYPDNVRSNGKGGFYISLVTHRSEKEPGYDPLAPLPWARKLLIRLSWLLARGVLFVNSYAPNDYLGRFSVYIQHFGPFGDVSALPKKVIVVEVDENGDVIKTLQTQNGKLSFISEFALGEKYSYFGSPFTWQLWRIKTEYI